MTILSIFASLLLASCSYGLDVSVFDDNVTELSYGDKPSQKLDIYSPKNTFNCPIIAYIHGGGWNTGDKRDLPKQVINFFLNNGCIVISINYALAPDPIDVESSNEIRYTTQIADLEKSIRWIYNNISKYGGNTDEIYIIGHSAGAHLAAHLIPIFNDNVYSTPSIKSYYLLDAGAYLTGDCEIIPLYKELIANIQNAVGSYDIYEMKDFYPINNINQSNTNTQIFQIAASTPYRQISNQKFYEVLLSHGWSASIYILEKHTHADVLNNIPDYWDNITPNHYDN